MSIAKESSLVGNLSVMPVKKANLVLQNPVRSADK